MANSFSRSFELAKESFRLLLLDKELLLFPLLSGLSVILILVTFVFPLFFVGAVFSRSIAGLAFYLWLFLFYLVSYFVSIFFNVAIISCVSMRLKGKDPVLPEKNRAVNKRRRQDEMRVRVGIRKDKSKDRRDPETPHVLDEHNLPAVEKKQGDGQIVRPEHQQVMGECGRDYDEPNRENRQGRNLPTRGGEDEGAHHEQ
jgi:hypothetical protein